MKKRLTILVLAMCLVIGIAAPAYGATNYTNILNGSFFNKLYQYTYDKFIQLQSNLNQGSNGGSGSNQGNQNNNSGSNDSNNDNNTNNSENPSYQLTISENENQVVELVNKERKAAGLSPLTVNTDLSKIARLKAQDMSDNNYFSHTSPTYGSAFDMMKANGIKYTLAGENIAKGQKTPQNVMTAWMNSSGHKANIMKSEYTQIGVGYVKNSKGTTYWVQMFIK